MKLNLQRSPGVIIFDTVFLVLLIAVWGIIIWLVGRAPDIVPTHFGPSGQPDAYGPPSHVLIPCAIVTIVAVIMLVCAHFPQTSINLPGYNKEKANPRQNRLAGWLARILAVFMLVLTLCIAISTLALTSHSILPMLVIAGIMIATGLVFTILIIKAK